MTVLQEMYGNTFSKPDSAEIEKPLKQLVESALRKCNSRTKPSSSALFRKMYATMKGFTTMKEAEMEKLKSMEIDGELVFMQAKVDADLQRIAQAALDEKLKVARGLKYFLNQITGESIKDYKRVAIAPHGSMQRQKAIEMARIRSQLLERAFDKRFRACEMVIVPKVMVLPNSMGALTQIKKSSICDPLVAWSSNLSVQLQYDDETEPFYCQS